MKGEYRYGVQKHARVYHKVQGKMSKVAGKMRYEAFCHWPPFLVLRCLGDKLYRSRPKGLRMCKRCGRMK